MAKRDPNSLIGVHGDARPRVYIGHCRPDGAHWRVHPTARPRFADSIGKAVEEAIRDLNHNANVGVVIIVDPRNG